MVLFYTTGNKNISKVHVTNLALYFYRLFFMQNFNLIDKIQTLDSLQTDTIGFKDIENITK